MRLVDATALRPLHRPGYALSHVTPAALPQGGFPKAWEDPFTGQRCRTGPNARALAAVERAVSYLVAAEAFWAGGSLAGGYGAPRSFLLSASVDF